MQNKQWIATNLTRGERILERLVTAKKLTKNGEAAILAAVDPFHDRPIEHLRGWPDLESQPSIIRQVKRSATMTSTGDGHSIVIDSWPILNNVTTYDTARNNNVLGVVTDSVSTNLYPGGVTVSQYNTSSGQFSTATRVGSIVRLGPDSGPEAQVPGTSYLDAKTRLIGMGIEVHDVSAEIYKQGTVTVCQVPQSQRVDQTLWKSTQTIGIITYSGTAVTCRPVQNHPSTLGSAMLYEGTRQWEAKDGCYTVIPFSTEENPPRNTEYNQPLVYTSIQDELYNVNTQNVGLGYHIPQPGASPWVYFPNRWAPIHSKFIYLTGLNALSTFQINVIYYLESFPDFTESSLITLARPSACYDPLALRMISCASQELPVGVPVAENGLGDWFLDVIETVAPIAGEFFGGMIGGPAGALAGGAAGMALQGVVRGQRQNQQVTPPASMQKPTLIRNPNNQAKLEARKPLNKKKTRKRIQKLNRSDLMTR